MKKIVLTTFLLISYTVIFSQQNEKPEREAFELHLNVNQEQFYGMDVKSSAYFPAPNILQIYPSESLYIEAEIEDGKIITMKTVKENLNPEKTIKVEFKQVAKDRLHDYMILDVKNPFDKSLNYDASMYIVGHNKWITTSIIPILPKLSNYEMWPDVIITLALDNWRLEE